MDDPAETSGKNRADVRKPTRVQNLKTDFMKDNMITVIVNDDICDNMTLVSSNINVNFVGEGKEKRESDFTNKIYSYKIDN